MAELTMRLSGWTRLWILATTLWAVPVGILQYQYWEQNLSSDSVQRRHVRYMFDDLALAIDGAEGGRLESTAIDTAADALLAPNGRTIAGFEQLAKNPPTFVQRMKRVPFAAPENGMEIRYYVFPLGVGDEEVASALATESSRREITEWARNEPVRLDVLMRDAASAPRGAQLFQLETPTLLAGYQASVRQLPRDRLDFVLTTLGLWLVPSLLVYAGGSSVGWALRGFRDTKVIHYIGSAVIVSVLLLVIVVSFSEVESRFECSGEMSASDGPRPTTAFLRLVEYRWWVGVWNDSGGYLSFEIPKDVSRVLWKKKMA